MSDYSSGLLSQELIRRPLRYIRRIRAAQTEAFPPPPSNNNNTTTATDATTGRPPRRHTRSRVTVAASRSHALISSSKPPRAVLGVAVVTADDITPEERADVSTYFEAVAPDGEAWMEGLSTGLTRRSKSEGALAAGEGGTREDDDTAASALTQRAHTVGSDGFLSPVTSFLSRAGRKLETAAVKERSKNSGDGAQADDMPAFASFGAATVKRSRRKKPRESSHDSAQSSTPADNAKTVSPRQQHRQHISSTGAATATTDTTRSRNANTVTATATATVTTATAATAPHNKSTSTTTTIPHHRHAPHRRRDEATIVFSDPCVVALAGTAVTAFANAFQADANGVTVRVVLPHPQPHRRRSSTTVHARAADAPWRASDAMESIAAHALSVVNPTRTPRRRETDRAVVLVAEALDDHVQQCAQEAKTSQRPRFRRRTSLEVYGRSVYATA